jgi:hypothetical protein
MSGSSFSTATCCCRVTRCACCWTAASRLSAAPTCRGARASLRWVEWPSPGRRWARHVVVGVSTGCPPAELELQLLINPQNLRLAFRGPEGIYGPEALPCALLGFGAMLVRRRWGDVDLLSVPYRLLESVGGVRGEDIGFCADVLSLSAERGDVALQPHFLCNHEIVHINGVAPWQRTR